MNRSLVTGNHIVTCAARPPSTTAVVNHVLLRDLEISPLFLQNSSIRSQSVKFVVAHPILFPAITNSWASSSNSIRQRSFLIRAFHNFTTATTMPEWLISQNQVPRTLRLSTQSSTKSSRIVARVHDVQHRSFISLRDFFQMSRTNSFYSIVISNPPVSRIVRPRRN